MNLREALEEPEPRSLARRAVEALQSGSYDGVIIRCWDKAEANEVISFLPAAYRNKIQVTWTTFPTGPK